MKERESLPVFFFIFHTINDRRALLEGGRRDPFDKEGKEGGIAEWRQQRSSSSNTQPTYSTTRAATSVLYVRACVLNPTLKRWEKRWSRKEECVCVAVAALICLNAFFPLSSFFSARGGFYYAVRSFSFVPPFFIVVSYVSRTYSGEDRARIIIMIASSPPDAFLEARHHNSRVRRARREK